MPEDVCFWKIESYNFKTFCHQNYTTTPSMTRPLSVKHQQTCMWAESDSDWLKSVGLP